MWGREGNVAVTKQLQIRTNGELTAGSQAKDELTAGAQANGELTAGAQAKCELTAGAQANGELTAGSQTNGELTAGAQAFNIFCGNLIKSTSFRVFQRCYNFLYFNVRLCFIVVLGKGFLKDLYRYLIRQVTSLLVTVCVFLVILSATVREMFTKIVRN